jgi:exopolysaccharide biosynthesis polyprenyl glycosylphosphotransferase
VFSRHYRKVKALFGLSDVLLTGLAFEAAYQTRSFLPFSRPFYFDRPVKALLLGAAVLIWLAIGYWFHIYDKLESAHPRAVLRNAFRQCAIGAAVMVLVDYVLRPTNYELSRPFLLLFAVYSWLCLCLFRLNAGRIAGAFRKEFGAPYYVMVVGDGEPARRIGELVEASEEYGLRLSGFLSPEDSNAPAPVALRRNYQTYPLSELPNILRERVVDEVIFAVDSERLARMEEMMLLCDEEGVRTRVSVDFFPHVNSRVYLDRLGGAPLLTFASAPHDEIRLLVKRLTDIVLAAAALVLLAPFMLLIAALIRVTSPGPAIFRQQRCGLNGRRFTFYKFRSMVRDAEKMKAALEHLNQKSTAFKIRDDPRLTPMGRRLRKFSIDEWPQLWNVLKGDMSLVGPRPAVPGEVERYQRWQRRRLRMRPGLTCIWATRGRDALDFDTWMKMDMQYIDNWSLALDWKIILRTIPRVVTGKGAN